MQLLRDLDAVERTIVAIGSHDPVLDLAASLLRARDPLQTLVSGPVGSLSGLVALRDGLCHLSGCHLLDPDTGEYTLPWIERVMPGKAVDGHPARPSRAGTDRRRRAIRSGSKALPTFRGCATSTASAARVPACCSITSSGSPASSQAAIDGYEREEPTHLAVAAAISAGRADAGLGVMAAALAFGLDFVPVAREPFDLVMAPGEPAVAPLLELLRGSTTSSHRSRRWAATRRRRRVGGSPRSLLPSSGAPAAAHLRHLAPPTLLTWQSHASRARAARGTGGLHHIGRTDHSSTDS